MEYSWNIDGILMEYWWNIDGILMEYWWNMYGLLWTILDMCKQKLASQKELMQFGALVISAKRRTIKLRVPQKNLQRTIHGLFTSYWQKKRGVSINGNYPKMEIFSWYKLENPIYKWMMTFGVPLWLWKPPWLPSGWMDELPTVGTPVSSSVLQWSGGSSFFLNGLLGKSGWNDR